MGRAKFLHEIGITPGFHAIAGLAKADMKRVKKAEVAIFGLQKRPGKKRAKKMKREDEEMRDLF